MAELFDVSLDFLAFDDRKETRNGAQIADRELLEKIQTIDRLPEAEKTTVNAVLNSFILEEQFQRLARGEKARQVSG